MPPGYPTSLLVGYFDYAVLAVLVLATALLFGLVLPLLSIRVEMALTQRAPGIPTDSFELLYTLFRFPGYWTLFLIQVGVFQAYSRRKRLLSLRYHRQHARP